MTDEFSGSVGPVDYPVLRQIRDLLLEEEPLVDSVGFDDPVNPTELVVEFTTGLDTPGRFEITWWASGAYRFHYTESSGFDFRFDNHPKDSAPDAHFHPPPDAGRAQPSFLTGVVQPQIVTRAILSRWRRAIVDDSGLETLNLDGDGADT
ncbi:hypothetical protein [Haloglomus litoreum]|uniref:hypothetical protein n=1 Tax=Haloglomus litoreum TaxID=3034026 RepID=UPI0023E772F0|nr:hypothetical protein [Haloglomus sp. DT116]